jgi:hypothetical protein
MACAPPAAAGAPAVALGAGVIVAAVLLGGVSGAALLDDAQALTTVGSTSASTTGSRFCIAVLH